MSFKNYFIPLSIVFTLFYTSCSTKDPNSFSISGKIPNLNTNYALLSKIENIQKRTTLFIDTLKINKRGRFNSVYLLEPGIYNLTFDKKTIQLAIDRGQNIEISGNTLDNIRVKGSIDTQLLNDYEAFRIASLNRLVISVRNQIKELQKAGENESKIAELRELEVENYKKHLNELVTFVKDKMGTSIAVYATSSRWNGENLPFLQSLFSNFEKSHPNLEITKKLKNKLNLLQKTSVGGAIGTIEMPNKDGEIISLNTIKGKYTLVDFWASWCPPCRTESVLLNDLYQLYKSKGFEIYGISLDSKRKSWLNAIEKDKRVWTEVSTVEGFDTPVSTEYGITALPTNFLIDATGKIIAVNIHGKHLKEKVESLFDK